MLGSILVIMAAHLSCHVAGDREVKVGGGGFSDGIIIRNISVKEFLYYIRCEANRFLEKRSNQGRSGDGDIEEDSVTARGDESGLEGHRRRGRVSSGQWSGKILFTCQSSDGNRPQEGNQDMEMIRHGLRDGSTSAKCPTSYN